MDLLETLIKIGLNKREAKIYLAALELGGGSVFSIAKRAKVGRVGAYYNLEKMTERGFFTMTKKGSKKFFVPESPKKLDQLLQERSKIVKDALPELLSITNTLSYKPVIRFYEGKNGLSQALFDPLETLMKLAKQERVLYAYASAEAAFSALPEEQNEFIRRRIKLKIPVKWIAPNTEPARELKTKDHESLREMRLIPPGQFKLLTEMNIYGDKISLLGERGAEIAVIIEHKEIAQTQKEIFELAWLGAEKINNY